MELQVIENKIYEIRGQQVMLDFDLAMMYGVEARVLNQAVKRNIERFPIDFMFQITPEEWRVLKIQLFVNEDITNNSSQIVMSSMPKNRSGKYLPYAFTEHGITMLSSVLKSKMAIEINIKIIRAFVAVRRYIVQMQTTKTIDERIKALEQANEELLKDMNDLSEDTRKSFDELFNSFSKLANRVNINKKIENEGRVRIIGFSQKDN
jgi:hypothetical protein